MRRRRRWRPSPTNQGEALSSLDKVRPGTDGRWQNGTTEFFSFCAPRLGQVMATTKVDRREDGHIGIQRLLEESSFLARAAVGVCVWRACSLPALLASLLLRN